MLRLSKFLFLLSLLCVCSKSFAKCKEVRLDKNGGPFEQLPVYDQLNFSNSDPGICYAIAASQLLDANRIFQGESKLEQLTSPVSLAANATVAQNEASKNFNINKLLDLPPDHDLKGGTTINALDSATDTPICDQRYLEKFAPLIGEKIRNPLSTKLLEHDTVSSLTNFLKSLLKQKYQIEALKSDIAKFKIQPSAADFCANNYLKMRLSDKNIQDIQEAVLHSLHQQDAILQIQGVLKDVCKDHSFKLKPVNAENYDGVTPEERDRERQLEEQYIQAVLDHNKKKEAALEKEMKKMNSIPSKDRMSKKIEDLLSAPNPVPVSIAYNARMLYGDPNMAVHASVIVGQRPDASGKCEFLIRNSYGPNCDKDYVFPCEKETGSIWVPAEKLKSQTFSITWINR